MATKDQDLRKKRAEVSNWLSQVLKHEPIPDFEVNAETIQLLHRLSIISQHNEKNSQLYVEDLKKKSEEYNADAQRIAGILERLTLGQNCLSRSGSSCVHALARTGASLCVKNASDTCFMLSLRELQSNINEVKERLEMEEQDMQRLSKKTQGVLLNHSSLQKALDILEKRAAGETAKIAERKKEIAILKKATAENETIVEKLKTHIAKSGVSETDFHDKLVKKKEKLDAVDSELAPLKSELKSFTSLPPDAIEAKVKIEQLKRELSRLQTQMSECVDVTLLQ